MPWLESTLKDEVWLMARRSVWLEFERGGIDLHSQVLAARIETMRHFIPPLIERLLRDLPAPESQFILRPDFGREHNHQWREKLPRLLASGFVHGLELGRLRALPDQVVPILSAAISYVHLAATLIDSILDELGLGSSLVQQFNVKSIWRRVLGGSGSDSSAPEVSEVSVALRLIELAFAELRSAVTDDVIEQRIVPVLASAYEVELRSTTCAWDAEAGEVSIRCSQAPFLAYAAMLNAVQPGNGREELICVAAEALGKAYAIADDLSDLVFDLENGHLNSVVCRSGVRKGAPLREALIIVLESSAIQWASKELFGELDRLTGQILTIVQEPDECARVPILALAGVRTWLS
jgi:hypothetical protein